MNAIDSVDAERAAVTPPSEFSRRAFVATRVIAGFTLATGPVNAQAVITTDSAGLTAGEVKIPVADGQLPAYRAMPANGSALATAGYLAIAPELFARHADMSKVTTLDEARAVAGKVADAQVMSDLDAATVWAKGNGGDTAKLGITGFCYGGRVTWLYSAHSRALEAGVGWYGVLNAVTNAQRPKHPLDLVNELKAPVLGLYGSADQGIPNVDVEEMRAALEKAGKPGEVVLYDGAPHGFHAGSARARGSSSTAWHSPIVPNSAKEPAMGHHA